METRDRLARALSFSGAALGLEQAASSKATGDNLSPVQDHRASAEENVSRNAVKAGPVGKIRVHLRMRPRTATEQSAGEQSCVESCSMQSVTFKPPRHSESSHASAHRAVRSETYHFDSVFAEDATQTGVYEGTAQQLVRNVCSGKSGLIFAFGITNAGKTHTVHGSDTDPGLLPRAIEQLFHACGEDSANRLSISCMEIYNDTIFDLLRDKSKCKAGRTRKSSGLQLKEDERGNVFAKGLTDTEVQSVEHALELLSRAREARQVAFTAANSTSSRSHSIVTIKLHAHGDTSSELVVVDLAGSERTGRTKNSGARLKESARINTSLMNLGRCLEVLRSNQQLAHRASSQKMQVVPFRQSKITRVLQGPLTATDSNVVMVCNVYTGERDFDETAHALRYAAIARDVVTGTAATNGQRTTRFANGFVVRAKLQGQQTVKCGASVLPSVPEKPTGAESSDCGDLGQLVAQNRDEIMEHMEQEIRNELAEEMESTIEMMEQSYRDKLARETAIYEAKFEHKLKLLTVFDASDASDPDKVVNLLEELSQLRSENDGLSALRAEHSALLEQFSTLKQQETATRRELAALTDRANAEQEEHRVQCEANLAMEVETLEFQLDQATKENDRLREEVSSLSIRYSESQQQLVQATTARIEADKRIVELETELATVSQKRHAPKDGQRSTTNDVAERPDTMQRRAKCMSQTKKTSESSGVAAKPINDISSSETKARINESPSQASSCPAACSHRINGREGTATQRSMRRSKRQAASRSLRPGPIQRGVIHEDAVCITAPTQPANQENDISNDTAPLSTSQEIASDRRVGLSPMNPNAAVSGNRTRKRTRRTTARDVVSRPDYESETATAPEQVVPEPTSKRPRKAVKQQKDGSTPVAGRTRKRRNYAALARA